MSNPAMYDEFISDLAKIESQEFLEDLSEELGETVDELIQSGFTRATDPYGDPWAPRKLARGRTTPPHLPLQKTMEMRESFAVHTSAEGVKVTNPVIYTGYIQGGTRFIPAREMLPDPARGLGDWEEHLREKAQKVMNETMNQGGG